MGSFQSLIFYICMFFISVIFVYRSEVTKNEVKRRILLIIGLSIPILISGLRWEVGTDFNTYRGIYAKFSEVKFSSNEVLFIYIIKIAKFFGDVQWLFMIYSILTIFFVYKAIRYNSAGRILWLTYASYLFFSFTASFNVMRQALAVSMVLYSYKYIFEKKFFRFILWIIIAAMTHTTALLCIPIYFIVPRADRELDKVRIIQIIAIVVSAIIVLKFDYFMGLLTKFDSFERYSSYIGRKDGGILSIIESVSIVAIFIYFRKFFINVDSKNNIYILFNVIGVILLFSGLYSPYLKRIAMFFQITQIYIFGSIPLMFKDKKAKDIVIFFILIYMVARFVLTTYILGQGGVIPYKIK